jgi:heme/copper-type cytochrome/quinol oxidase subunit 4
VTPVPPFQPVMQPEVRGWNEYDNGSEAGEEAYYIDINPEESDSFPGMDKIRLVFAAPVKKIQSLFSRSSDKHAERESLLTGSTTPQADYFGTRRNSVPTTDGEATDDDASSTEYPSYGYSTHYAALPSVEAQRVERFRELVLHRSVVISFAVAVILTMVAAILVGTGRHKLRLEVDAGVTLAVVTSLFAGCMGLSAMMYRQDTLSWMYRLTVWVTFIAACLLNGMLLVLVVGSNGI